MTVQQLVSSFVAANAMWWQQLRMRRYITRLDVDFEGLYERVHAGHAPIFVLSPGRSGSLLLTRILALDRQLLPVHEPRPELGWHNTWALMHPECTDRAADYFDGARYEFIRDVHLTGRRYVETNNRCTFFARAIVKLYPRAQFIHLVRNPVSFVRSGLSRRWYTGRTLYDASRPVGSGEDWDRMDRVEKIAWLWQVTHAYADEFKSDHPGRVHTVIAEQLFSDCTVANPIFRFLGRPVPNQRSLRRVTQHRVNPNTKEKVALSPTDEQRILARTAVARTYYPELNR